MAMSRRGTVIQSGDRPVDGAPWISVGALAHAFSEESYAPEQTADLAGKTLALSLMDGGELEYRFESATHLSWTFRSGRDVNRPETTVEAGRADNGGSGGSAVYFAAKLREGFYFVDHIKTDERATSVTLLLDLDHAAATVMTGRLPGEAESREVFADRIAQGKELTAVATEFSSAAIDRPFGAHIPRHEATLDMVGRRVEYTYSPTECYEHIYLNERFYTWHCLRGSEKGLADTDRCHYLRLADRLYFFVWREKIVPTLGAVVVDFEAMRTTGKIFGYRGDEDGGISAAGLSAGGLAAGGSPARGLSNFPVGARARMLSGAEGGALPSEGATEPA